MSFYGLGFQGFILFYSFFSPNFDRPIPLEVSLARRSQSRGNFLSLASLSRGSSGGECTHHPSFVTATGLHYGVQALKRAEPAGGETRAACAGRCPGVSLSAVNAALPQAIPTTSLILSPPDPFHAGERWNCAVVSLKSGGEPGTMDFLIMLWSILRQALRGF